jgi:hypothetical protein
MHNEIYGKGDPRIEVPPIERCGERQLSWRAAAPVHDPGHEYVGSDHKEDEVGEGEASSPFDEGSNPDDLGGHPTESSAALEEVYNHERDKGQADVSMEGDPNMQELQRAECGRR